MWKCDKCGVELNIDVKPPIRCTCGSMMKNETLLPNGRPDLQKLREVRGREAWEQLHSYKYQSEEETKFFYEFWVLTIPSFGCSCKSHWNEVTKDLPPDFSSAENFFRWGVEAHNRVNLMLGKPQFSYEEAKVVYNFTNTF